MEERSLGATGLRVSRIGLGLAAVGRPAYITLGRETDLAGDRSVEALRGRSHELLDAAITAGVRYVDVARSYGLAEEFLGSWLDGRPPDAIIPTIGSKWGYTYVGDWRLDAEVHEVKDQSLAAFRRQLAETRTILGDRLSLYQVHSATLESGILEDRAVLGALAELSADGRCRAYRQRSSPGRRRPAGPRGSARWAEPVRLGSGDLERPGAIRRTGPRRGARGGLGRHRQGGPRKR